MPNPVDKSDYLIYLKHSDRKALANIVDPDQTPLNAASDLGLQCLPLIQQFVSTSAGSQADIQISRYVRYMKALMCANVYEKYVKDQSSN